MTISNRAAAVLIALGLVLMFLGITIVTTGGDSNLNEILFSVGLVLAALGVIIALRRATAGR